jgi:hypothetical protein
VKVKRIRRTKTSNSFFSNMPRGITGMRTGLKTIGRVGHRRLKRGR